MRGAGSGRGRDMKRSARGEEEVEGRSREDRDGRGEKRGPSEESVMEEGGRGVREGAKEETEPTV